MDFILDMNNNIAFTGFNSLYLAKKFDTRLGSYVCEDGHIGQGTKKYAKILLKCELSDDLSGADLTEFKSVLNYCADSYQARLVKQKSDNNSIKLLTTRCMVKDERTGNKIFNTNFELNGVEIQPNDRKILPLFTYLAKLTRKLRDLPEISEERVKCLNTVNKGIAEEATKFIDNM